MRFFGAIGFVKTEETAPDVFTEIAEEREYYGDVTRQTTKWQPSEYLNDNLNVTNQFRILADGYMLENMYAMRYVVWHGSRWKILTIDEERPRVVLTIGGVWNGRTPETGDDFA